MKTLLLIVAAAIALPTAASAEAPPFTGPTARGDCPKGFIKKRGKCWRRTTDDISAFTDDEEVIEAWEREVERRLNELPGKSKR